jgi:hypothetical protein
MVSMPLQVKEMHTELEFLDARIFGEIKLNLLIRFCDIGKAQNDP